MKHSNDGKDIPGRNKFIKFLFELITILYFDLFLVVIPDIYPFLILLIKPTIHSVFHLVIQDLDCLLLPYYIYLNKNKKKFPYLLGP